VLVERISFRGLCRTGGITRQGLLGLLGQGVEALAAPLPVQPLPGPGPGRLRHLAVEAEARASWVQQQAHQPGLGSAWLPRAARGVRCMAGIAVGGVRSACG